MNPARFNASIYDHVAAEVLDYSPENNLTFIWKSLNINLTMEGGGENGTHHVWRNQSERKELIREYYSIFVPILLVMASGAFCINGYILMSISWLRKPISSNLCLSLSLAAVDAWTSALTVFVFVLNSYLPIVHGVHLHFCLRLVVVMLQMGGLLSSVLHLFFLALNHFCGIVYPFHHKRYMTGSVKRGVLYSLWIVPPLLFLAFCCVVPEQAFLSDKCQRVRYFEYVLYRATVFAIIFLPMLLTFILYFRIVLLLMRQRHRDPILTQNQPESQNRKLFITMLLITGSFLFGWLPSCTVFLVVCRHGCPVSPARTLEQLRLFSIVYMIVNACIVLKLFLNPLIYATRILELRYALWRMHTNRWSLSTRRTMTTKIPKEFETIVNRGRFKSLNTGGAEMRKGQMTGPTSHGITERQRALRKLVDNDELVLMEEIQNNNNNTKLREQR